jgi:hypothetical protein
MRKTWAPSSDRRWVEDQQQKAAPLSGDLRDIPHHSPRRMFLRLIFDTAAIRLCIPTNRFAVSMFEFVSDFEF